MDDAIWKQFRRLLLGTLVEVLRDAGVDVDLRTLHLEFEHGSSFRVPRFDNYMRFVGEVEGVLDTPLPPERIAALEAALASVWPELLGVVILPIGDRLTSTRNEVEVEVEDGVISLEFDLEAD